MFRANAGDRASDAGKPSGVAATVTGGDRDEHLAYEINAENERMRPSTPQDRSCVARLPDAITWVRLEGRRYNSRIGGSKEVRSILIG
jgi:hypothetical protein